MSAEVGRLADFPARLTQAERDTRALIEDLDGAQLNWQPEPRKWSILQVLEHLAISAELYQPVLAAAVEQGRTAGLLGDVTPRAGVVERIFLWSMRSTVKLKAPASTAVRGASDLDPDQVIARWSQVHAALADIAANGNDLDQNRVRITSPLASILKLSLGVAFEVLVVHEQRHAHQIRRILADPGFPRR